MAQRKRRKAGHPDHADVLDAIERIYAAALDPAEWSAAVETAGRLLDADGGLLQIRSGEAEISYVGFGLDPEYSRSYLEYYGARDPYSRAARTQAVPGEVLWDYELVAPERLRGLEIYEDLLRPQGIHGTAQNIGGVVHAVPGLFAHIQFVSRARRRHLPAAAYDTVRAVVPHIRRALDIQARLVEAKRAEDAIDRLRVGVAFLDARGRVVRMNRAAAETLAARDGLQVTGGFLRAAGRDEAALQRIIGAARAPASDAAFESVAIRRSPGRPPVSVMAVPATRTPDAFRSMGAEVTLFITDPLAGAATPPAATLLAAYGLTPAEARVAILVGEGRSPKEAAQALDVTLNTVRTLLKRAFAKMGIDRQAALARLLAHSLPPVR